MPIRGKLQRLTEKTAGLRFSSRKWDEGKDPHDHHPANNFDRFRNGIENMIDMPERTLNKLFGFLRQIKEGFRNGRKKPNSLAYCGRNFEDRAVFADSFGEDGAA